VSLDKSALEPQLYYLVDDTQASSRGELRPTHGLGQPLEILAEEGVLGSSAMHNGICNDGGIVENGGTRFEESLGDTINIGRRSQTLRKAQNQKKPVTYLDLVQNAQISVVVT
jgi:hypothetical protein